MMSCCVVVVIMCVFVACANAVSVCFFVVCCSMLCLCARVVSAVGLMCLCLVFVIHRVMLYVVLVCCLCLCVLLFEDCFALFVSCSVMLYGFFVPFCVCVAFKNHLFVYFVTKHHNQNKPDNTTQ